MKNREIVAARLHNQHLVRPWLKHPADIVRWLGAVQAQDFPGAKWALGQRLADATDDQIDRAFADGTFLRTHVLRPTWHFVAPEDIRFLLALTAPRVHALSAPYYRKCEFDEKVFRLSAKVLRKLLGGGKQLTRDELRVAFTQAGISTSGELRMSYLMLHAELEGIVCSGPRRGKQFTYCLLEERVPACDPLERDEALARIVERYFLSRGPATLQDFVWWSGLTMSDARRGIDAVKARFERQESDGQTYWFAGELKVERGRPRKVYLLPNYDEYGIAYRDRSAMFDSVRIPDLIFNHLIVIDGRVAGTWRRTLKKDGVLLEVNTFEPLRSIEARAMRAEARRYGTFLGVNAIVE